MREAIHGITAAAHHLTCAHSLDRRVRTASGRRISRMVSSTLGSKCVHLHAYQIRCELGPSKEIQSALAACGGKQSSRAPRACVCARSLSIQHKARPSREVNPCEAQASGFATASSNGNRCSPAAA